MQTSGKSLDLEIKLHRGQHLPKTSRRQNNSLVLKRKREKKKSKAWKTKSMTVTKGQKSNYFSFISFVLLDLLTVFPQRQQRLNKMIAQQCVSLVAAGSSESWQHSGKRCSSGAQYGWTSGADIEQHGHLFILHQSAHNGPKDDNRCESLIVIILEFSVTCLGNYSLDDESSTS